MKILYLILVIVLVTSSCSFAQTGHWEQLFPQNSPTNRTVFGMAKLTKDKILLFGGLGSGNKFNNETWLYEYSKNNWSKLNVKNSPPIRGGLGMLQISDGKVLLFGGHNNSTYFNDTWLFDIKTMDWKLLTTLGRPFKRSNFAWSKITDNNILLFGGDVDDSIISGSVNDTWLFDISNQQWTLICSVGCPIFARSGSMMALLDTGKVILYGGNEVGGPFDDTWIFEIKSLKWSRIYPIQNAPPITSSNMVNIDKNIVLWFGGGSEVPNIHNETWIYYLNNNLWKNVSVLNSPPSRASHGLVLIDTNKILLFGGTTNTGWLNDTWLLTIDSLTEVADSRVFVSGFEITPNPASDFIEISVGANGRSPLQSEFRIFNVYGQTVLSVGAIHELPLRIDISGLAPGMYFARIGDRVGKFVKLRK